MNMIVVTTVVLSLLALTLDYGLGVVEQLLRLHNGEEIERAKLTHAIWSVIA
ncbi:hypothetical protein VB773_00500 [Haloarculaceae archaeon H-GB2-1]|nr:hypothetical protein [Haloarculaceae archaeon H-GB11]MEA5406203.1 hypothetical protein [Haloarculaceae archaeon H-GB2-1]